MAARFVPLLLLVLSTRFKVLLGLPDLIPIGGLFHPSDDKQEIAFRYAIEKINSDRTILPRSKLQAQIEKIPPQDSFHASKKVCHLLRTGVAAIFGPQSPHTASHVQSICDTMEIPHLETRWDYRLRRESCLVNLYPHPTTLSRAYVDLVKAWGWKSFTIIYENNEGLVRLQELLKAHGPYEFPITVRQLVEGNDYRPLLKQIKNSAESHIVLDCSTPRIYDVLKQAQQIGMMSDYHSYLITSLDLHGVDLEEFKYGGTNITAFRLVDPDGPEIRRAVRDWNFPSDVKNKKGDTIPSLYRDNTTFVKLEAYGDDTLVKVRQGVIQGHFLTTPANKTFRAFQGVPYAKPPIGPLRFQKPAPLKPWEGIRNATTSANMCFVIESDSSNENEDCLYLNVYTPILTNDNATKLAVLLWIHGGGYSHGNSLYSNFGPDYLIEKDIIIVTISYRLGPFGFLATGDTVIPGNAGLKDQAAAIKWTFENIEYFGGDPTKITISGQSAGGSSVGYQLFYKENEGLFRAAILQSGSPLSVWSYLNSNRSRDYAFYLAKQINGSLDLLNNSTLLLDFLSNVEARTIDEASTRTSITRPLPVIEPEHDGAFLTESQYTLLEAGDFIRVPIIIGTTSEEQISKAKDLETLNQTLVKYETSPEEFIPGDFDVQDGINKTLVGIAIKNLYLQNTPEDEKMGHIVRYLSHSRYTTPMIKHADLVSKYIDVYFYVFSHDGPMGDVNVTLKGADSVNHAEDPKYLFKKIDSSYSNDDLSKFPKADVMAHDRLIELWSNFVKYLNPTFKNSDILQNVKWPKYTSNEAKYIDIGENLELKHNPKSPYYKAWVQFYDEWAKKPYITF